MITFMMIQNALQPEGYKEIGERVKTGKWRGEEKSQKKEKENTG